MSGGSGSTSQRAGTHLETLAVHGGEPEAGYGGAVVVPVFQSSTYLVGEAGTPDQVRYIRWNNTPNHEVLHRRLALLEGGEDALVTASGMAAISASLLAVLQPGDHLVVQQSLYGGTFEFVWRFLPVWGVRVSWFDPVRPETLQVALEARTRAVLVESISNPLLEIADLPAVVEIARAAGVILMVDNTFATPFFQRPLKLGADVVVHSATKYISGHGDVIAGIAVAKDRDYAGELKFGYMCEFGGVMSPFTGWLLLRGLKTLALRMREHEKNALAVARYLEQHPRVKRVYYPGLPSSPGHETAKAQMSGFGGMVSFDIDGTLAQSKQVVNSMRLFKLAVSLGDCESLVEHPFAMTHRGYTEDEIYAAGLTPSMIRLSIGLEHQDDLIADLEQALSVMG